MQELQYKNRNTRLVDGGQPPPEKRCGCVAAGVRDQLGTTAPSEQPEQELLLLTRGSNRIASAFGPLARLSLFFVPPSQQQQRGGRAFFFYFAFVFYVWLKSR